MGDAVSDSKRSLRERGVSIEAALVNEPSMAVVSYHGHQFRFVHDDANDHIFKILKSSGTFYEIELLERFADLLSPDQLVVDVGACIGTHSVFAAGVCQARVIAIEPNEKSANLLRRNLALNGLDANVRVEQFGLGAAPSHARIMQQPAHNQGMSALAVAEDGDITIRRLDDLNLDGPVRLIKIDVEGMEPAVLEGAAATLQRDRPILIVEAADRTSFSACAGLVRRHGYKLAGTYNWTPTHLFVPAEEPGFAAIDGALTETLTLAQFDWITLRNRAFSSFGSIEAALSDQARQLDALAIGGVQVRELTQRSAEAEAKVTKLEAALAAAAAECNVARSDAAAALTNAAEVVAKLAIAAAERDATRGALHAAQTDAVAVRAQLAEVEKALAAVSAERDVIRSRCKELDAKLLAVSTERDASKASAEIALALLRQCASGLEGIVKRGRSKQRTLSGRIRERILLRGKSRVLINELRSLAVELREAEARALGRSRPPLVAADVAKGFAEIERHLRRIGAAPPDPKEKVTPPKERPKGPTKRRKILSPERWFRWPNFPTGPDAKSTARKSHAKSEPPARDSSSVWHVRVPGRADKTVSPSPGTLASSTVALAPRVEEASPHTITAEADYSKGWEGHAWPHREAALERDGVVRCKEASSETGFVSRLFDFAGGGLLEVEINTHGASIKASTRILRIVTDAGEGVGPDFPLRDGITTVRAFAPCRTGKIKLYVLGYDMEPGETFVAGHAVLRRLDPDLYQKQVRANVGEPVLASMASIPSRRATLEDSVRSLLLQCDRVRVFLNGYPDIPDVLNHPRVDIRRSQDWDDRGDAGKMFWLEQDAATPGFRLTVDDDLIFPPDYAETMARKVAAWNNSAIYSMHGVLLRQPFANYYEDSSRAATFHFARQLRADRRVHIGGTGALCLHSSAVNMSWSDFKYCNSADLWLALYAQQNNIPILTPARPRFWIRENKQEFPDDTIYRHSRNRTRSRFDSSLVQDAVLKHHGPLTVQTGSEPKYGLLVLVETTEGLAPGIERALAGASEDAEWVMLLAFDHQNAGLQEAVASMRLERETHLIDTSGDPGGVKMAGALMRRISLEAVLCVASDAASTAPAIGGEPQIGLPDRHGDMAIARIGAQKEDAPCGLVLTSGPAIPDAIKRLADDILGAAARPVDAFRSTFDQPPARPPAPQSSGEASINSVFERVLVLNLDRRPDRWAAVSASLDRAGIVAQRFSAIDGTRPEVAEEYERYLTQPNVTVSTEVPPVRYARDLYLGSTSQMARIAHLESKGGKAIASRGAWGYLRSYELLLEQALADGLESLLVFDDDVLLHKDIRRLFAQAMAEIPDDWLILQLGTLQYNWSEPWAQWHSRHLYRTNGSAIGSHAVGMRFDILPFLLEHTKRMDMPYDVGALSAATRAFPERCFVIYPNLAIQSLKDSDIGSSGFQATNTPEEVYARYKWNPDDYQCN